MLPLIKDPAAVWAFGANVMNIDYEARWKDYLAKDNFKAKGAASAAPTTILMLLSLMASTHDMDVHMAACQRGGCIARGWFSLSMLTVQASPARWRSRRTWWR